MDGEWDLGEKRTKIKNIACLFKRIMCDIKLMCELFRPKHVGSYFCSKKVSGESALVSAYNASLKESTNSASRVIGILTKIISALQWQMYSPETSIKKFPSHQFCRRKKHFPHEDFLAPISIILCRPIFDSQ
jgi:hypothetical protein